MSVLVLLIASFIKLIVLFCVYYLCSVSCFIGWVGLELWVLIHRARLAAGMQWTTRQRL